MSTVLDLKIVPKVLSTIEAYGTTMAFSMPENADIVPGGELLSTSTLTMNRKASPPQSVDGSSEKFSIVIAASGLAWVPKAAFCTVTYRSVTYRVTAVEPVFSGDDVAAYVLTIEK